MPPLNICILIPAYKPGPVLCVLVREIQGLLDPADRVKFVITDDGSGDAYKTVFERLAGDPMVVLLRHAVNLGKGAALKTAFNHMLLHEDADGAVTADADGQHLAKDILAVGRALADNPKALILGCRAFDRDVPLKNKLGNTITSMVTDFLLGQKITDTQTGLRGIPRECLKRFLRLRTYGYDYEMDMLVTALNSGREIIQYPIATVYLDGNRSSHFNHLFDSFAIYFVFLRHTGNSLATACIDYLVFSLAYLLCGGIGASLVAGRVFACCFNFFAARKVVFKSTGSIYRQAVSYILLVCLFSFISYLLISILNNLGTPVLVAKLVIEFILFFVTFPVQRTFIFSNCRLRKKKVRIQGDI